MATKLKQAFFTIGGRALVIVFLVLSLVLMAVYSREGDKGFLHATQTAVSGMVAPFKFMGGAVGAGTETVETAVSNGLASETTLEALRNQNEELRNEIAQLEEYRQEAQRLQGLLALKDKYALESLTARVIGRSANAWEQVVTIDKGSDSGVMTGLPVMGSGGVIGQVVSTTPFSAEVRLLTDASSGVAAMVQSNESNRAEGIVRGSLEGVLFFDSIDTKAEIKAGDVIITSGLGGSYFSGLLIGTVVKVEDNQNTSSKRIVVAPNDTAGSLEEVLVATKMNSKEGTGEAA